jgi:hypothetical protein
MKKTPFRTAADGVVKKKMLELPHHPDLRFLTNR